MPWRPGGRPFATRHAGLCGPAAALRKRERNLPAPYPAEVVYGTGGQNTSRFIDRPQVTCSNRVFGDPAPGKRKAALSWFRIAGTDRIVQIAAVARTGMIAMTTVTAIGAVAPRKAGSATSTVASASVTAQMAGLRKAYSVTASGVTTAPSAIQHVARPRPAMSSNNSRPKTQKAATG